MSRILLAVLALVVCVADVYAEAPPEIPPKGGFVIFGDDWPMAASWRTIGGSRSRVSIDNSFRKFGKTSLRIESDIKNRMTLVISIDRLLERAVANRDMGLIGLSEKGALHFWLRADSSAGSIDMWFKSRTDLDGVGKKSWNSRFLSTQHYVTPGGHFQEVIIPLRAFGANQLNWFHLVKELHVRFPSSLQGRVYFIDEMRIIYDFDKDRLAELEKVRKKRLNNQAQNDPLLWVFRDSKQTKIYLYSSGRQEYESGGGRVPPGGLLAAYLQNNEWAGEENTDLYSEKDMNTFVVMDEIDPYRGKDSLNIHGDENERYRVSIPFNEADLSPIWARGCLNFAVKGEIGGELFDVQFRSRSGGGNAYTSPWKIENAFYEVTTKWQTVKLKLLDVGPSTNRRPFNWSRVSAVRFRGPRRGGSYPSYWIDEVWFGSCRDVPIR